MLLKLMKYEIKSTYKTFLMIYGVMFLLLFTNIAGGMFQSRILLLLSSTGVAFAIIPIMVVFVYTIIQRYNKNLYGDEGYLMFTLPVSSHHIVLCKLLTTILWSVATMIATTIAFIIFALWISHFYGGMPTWNEIYTAICYTFQYADWGSLTTLFLLMFLGCVESLLIVYLSITVSKLPIFPKLNNLIAVVLFFAVITIEQNLTNFILRMVTGIAENSEAYGNMLNSIDHAYSVFIHGYAAVLIPLTLVFIALYYFIITYLLNKKLALR